MESKESSTLIQITLEKSETKACVRINPLQMSQTLQKKFLAKNKTDGINKTISSTGLSALSASKKWSSSLSSIGEMKDVLKPTNILTESRKLNVNSPIGLHQNFHASEVRNSVVSSICDGYTSIQDAKFEKEEDYCEPSVVKYQVHETDGNIDTTNYQANNSVNYVLPIESFNKFKVILPKSKLELKTIDGTKVVVTRSSTNKNNCLEIENSASTKASSGLTNNNLFTKSLYKHPKSSLSILELLTHQRADLSSKLPSIYTNRTTVDSCNYVYCTKTKKFVIDSQTGLISCQNIKQVSVTEEKSNSDEVFVHPDFVLAPISSWLSSTYTKKLLRQYKPISSAVKRVASKVLCSSGRLTLKRLKDDDTKTAGESFQYIILSTKFGSFVQKRNLKVLQSSPVFIDDRGACFSKETDKFNNMAKVLQQPRQVLSSTQ